MNGGDNGPPPQDWAKPYEVRIAVLEERVRHAEKATALQAREYERRLTELNHAHDKQVADQATYVSMDKFDGFTAEVDTLDARLSQLEQFRSNFEGAQSGNKPVDALDARLSQLEHNRANVEGTRLATKPIRDLAMVIAGALLSYIATKLLA